MENAEQLFFDIAENTEFFDQKNRAIILNCPVIDNDNIENIDIFQPFKPHSSHPNIELPLNAKSQYDYAGIIGTKHVKETQYYIAEALNALKENGTLIVTADNKENGKRLEKWMKELSLQPLGTSKYKAKGVSVKKDKNLNKALLDQWIDDGRPQINPRGFYSQPGLFSWDRNDLASQLLIDTIDTPLRGMGADFGCGYGFLSVNAIKKHLHISAMWGHDADIRALSCYEKNMDFTSKTIKTDWCDLSKPYNSAHKYDFILMNPPFHEGRKDTPTLGLHFIENAARNLKKDGILWMVANKHLPYEYALKEYFPNIDKKAETAGFKVYMAVK